MGKKIIYLVTEDWYFLSHRLSIARAARQAGYDVLVATAVGEDGDKIRKEGFRLAPLKLDRSGRNPVKEFLALVEIVRLFRKERPDIVHHVALKPVLYGSMAATIAGVGKTVNALAGLGHVFVSKGVKASFVRTAVGFVMRLALGRKKAITIFQNPDDLRAFVDMGIVAENQTRLVKGSGVDPDKFTPPPREPAGEPVVGLPSRMLRTKGVDDFVEAARIMRRRGVKARMALIGKPDPHNPASLTIDELEKLGSDGDVEYWGFCEDMSKVMRELAVVVLPSRYGEGVPKSLIEAASAARPIVAYNIPGSREIVKNEVNGILIPPGSVEELAGAIERLAGDEKLRREMGDNGRDIVIREFSERTVVRETMKIYEENGEG